MTLDPLEVAADQFEAAADILEAVGATLKQHAPHHLAIKYGGWTLDIYPANCRLFSDRRAKIRPPIISVPKPWTLIDVAKAVARVIRAKEAS